MTTSVCRTARHRIDTRRCDVITRRMHTLTGGPCLIAYATWIMQEHQDRAGLFGCFGRRSPGRNADRGTTKSCVRRFAHFGKPPSLRIPPTKVHTGRRTNRIVSHVRGTELRFEARPERARKYEEWPKWTFARSLLSRHQCGPETPSRTIVAGRPSMSSGTYRCSLFGLPSARYLSCANVGFAGNALIADGHCMRSIGG